MRTVLFSAADHPFPRQTRRRSRERRVPPTEALFLQWRRAKGKGRLNQVNARKRPARNGLASEQRQGRVTHTRRIRQTRQTRIGHKLRQTRARRDAACAAAERKRRRRFSRFLTAHARRASPEKQTLPVLFFLSQFDSFLFLSAISRIFYYFCCSFVFFPLFLPENALSYSPLPFFSHDA